MGLLAVEVDDLVAELERAQLVHGQEAGAGDDGTVPAAAMWRFLTGLWPVIEQFPQYMAMNLLKVQYRLGAGHAMARKYLIRNIRVEQNHVEYWLDWALGHGIGREELFHATRSGAMDALSHWCWRTCHVDPLPVAMAATNYAIEGATGEWATLVCESAEYSNQFAPDVRKQFAAQATEIVIRGPDEFRKVVQQSMTQNAKVVAAVGLRGTQ